MLLSNLKLEEKKYKMVLFHSNNNKRIPKFLSGVCDCFFFFFCISSDGLSVFQVMVVVVE